MKWSYLPAKFKSAPHMYLALWYGKKRANEEIAPTSPLCKGSGSGIDFQSATKHKKLAYNCL